MTEKLIHLFSRKGLSEIEALTPGASVTALTSIYCEDIPDARDELYTLLQAVYEKGEK